jgi:small subunit ribosomal protein S8
MDTIANMLITLINGQRTGKQRVAVPYSKAKESLAKLLQEKGLISSIRVQEGVRAKIVITLAYNKDGQPVISGVKRLSTPGQRRYVRSAEIPYSLDGTGYVVISTSKGLMDDKEARKNGMGGELVCEIW